ncbi:MAG TPA: outer membrane lipoprotein carrier protein LolA [Chthoniobacteraceae bacterium]|nr:outer membrane lipoprotein carrier protein LolA [Chthoniobacteraceae bacterium]
MSQFGKRLKISVILCIACLLAGVFTAKAADMPAADVAALLKHLQELRDKLPAATAEFTEEKTSRLLVKPLSSEGKVSYEAPDKFRREVTGSNPSLNVSDGKTMWAYFPNFNEAEKFDIGQRKALNDSLSALMAGLNFEHIEEYYNFHVIKEAQGYQFQLSPKRPDLKRVVDHVFVWMDNDYLVQKVELFQQNGDHVVTTYKNVHRLASLPAGTFEFTPPAGAHVSYPLGK